MPFGNMRALALLGALVCCSQPALAQDKVVETIVLVRHGEKPPEGLGQLDCQGLNRALAVPAVVAKDFGRPVAIFAPDPSVEKDDDGLPYNYIRPLATIEPTAIALGLPVNASIALTDIDKLKDALEQPAYRSGFVLVAWEHKEIVKLARNLLAAHGGDPTVVPKWKGDDFDSIYVIRITTTGTISTVAFEHGHEGLNGQPVTCPSAK